MCDEQRFRETETFCATVTMFPSGSTKVFSWSISAVHLSSVSKSKPMQLSFSLTIPSNLLLSGGGERESSLSEGLHEILCEVTASQTKDGVMWSKTAVDGHCVRHSVTRVRHNVRHASRSVEGRRSRRAAKRRGHHGVRSSEVDTHAKRCQHTFEQNHHDKRVCRPPECAKTSLNAHSLNCNDL